MPRVPRSYIKTSYFHIMIQGINKSFIFNYSEDIKFYISTLYKLCKDYNINIIAYCIMNNHAHILLNTENIRNLSDYMHKVNTRYALYYNKKYNRVGYVFRNRYKCEGIYSEEHLYNCIKYIYDNPVKAGICNKPEEYKYSNFKAKLYNYDLSEEYVFIEDDENKEKICKKVVNEFLADNSIDMEYLKHDTRMLRRLIIILKNQYNLSIRSIAKELNLGREIKIFI